MGEHRSRIGATLLASVAVLVAAGTSTAASNAAGWCSPAVIGLLVAAALCLIGALWTFGAWAVLRRAWKRPEQERRELLSVAQKTCTELETCGRRLSKAKTERGSWRQLPAEIYNTQWTTSPLTAEEVAINKVFRDFYVWADEMNGKMARRAAAEYGAVGTVLSGKYPMLDSDEEMIAELDEGLSRVQNARDALGGLVERLSRHGRGNGPRG
jgi:hypothetical protein